MPLYVNTNVTSLNAQRQLLKSTGSLGKTFARLASGLRINSAKDDAAGMAITQRMTAQIRGMNQVIRNANDGVSLAQVAEGALDESVNSLQRIRELAVQSSNSTYNNDDRDNLQAEINQLMSEVQRIATQTQFNKQILLAGSYQSKIFQVGILEGQTIAIKISKATLDGLFEYATGLSNEDLLAPSLSGICNVRTASKAQETLSRVDKALDKIAAIRSNLGAIQNRFEAVIANMSNIVENMSAARSRIQDADIAAETAELTRTAILQQAGTAVLAQANQQPQLALQLLGSR
jgi:flagellin